MYVYEDTLTIFADQTVEDVKRTADIVREVGEAEIDLDKQEIRFKITTAEDQDIWDLAILVADLREDLAAYGWHLIIEKGNLRHEMDD